jgi:hypothetical protein
VLPPALLVQWLLAGGVGVDCGIVIPFLLIVGLPMTNLFWLLRVPYWFVRLDSEVDFQ